MPRNTSAVVVVGVRWAVVRTHARTKERTERKQQRWGKASVGVVKREMSQVLVERQSGQCRAELGGSSSSRARQAAEARGTAPSAQIEVQR